MPLFSLDALEAAGRTVYAVMPPTPQYMWPLLSRRLGTEIWVKHENHTPIGAFKVRGGIVYMDQLARSGRKVPGVVTATRGNHGQSIAFAATRAGIRSVIFVPRGNSVEKNAAMRAFGAELVEVGEDFDAAKTAAGEAAQKEGLLFLPSFDEALVRGVATYALEFFRAAPALDVVYVPIGLGSGLCGVITARDLLGLKTEVVGVVSDRADAYAKSVEAGKPVPTATAQTFADGAAVRVPDPEALEIIRRGAARIVRVSEVEAADAVRHYFSDTHNAAEGAGALPLAAAIKERSSYRGKRIGVVLTGGNVDTALFRRILAGETPEVGV